MRLVCAIALGLLSSVGFADRISQSPVHLKLSTTTTRVLGGQLEITLPREMQLDQVERLTSLGVKPSWRDEQRRTLELGDSRLVMIAYETYASIGADFRAAVSADLGTQGVDPARATIQKLVLARPLVGFEVVPRLPRSSLDAHVLIYAAYIGRVDGTVQVVAFYLSRSALPYTLPWTSLCRRIVNSATVGPHPIDQTAGDRRLGGMLIVTTPAGWATSMQIGAGAGPVAVHQLHQVAPLGTKPLSCVLQLGGEHEARANVATRIASLSGKLLNRAITWSEWSDSEGTVTEVAAERAWKGLPVLIRCRAPEMRQLPPTRKVIETLRLDDVDAQP